MKPVTFSFPKTILMTADTVGGVWSYTLELCRHLAPFQTTIVLATMGAPLREAQVQEAKKLANLVVVESDYKLEWMEDPWLDVDSAGEWLMGLERRYQPDLVHLNGYVHGSLPWHCPILLVAHSCVVSWWKAVKGCQPPEQWKEYRRRVAAGLQAAQLVVAPSLAMLNELVQCHGALKNRRVIPNARSGTGVVSAAKESFILGAGRLWDEAKNFSLLNLVAPKVVWPILLAGETTGPGGVQLPHDHLCVLGQLASDVMAGWLARAGIFASPTRYEPFGLSILEAAQAGCPLVLGNIASLQELWHGAATFVPPNDPEQWEWELNSLIKRTHHRQAMADLARKRAGQFSPEFMVLDYLDAYQHLLANASRKRKEGLCAS